jgi:voltage-gated potassium channel
VTITTVGYGDRYPVTITGRIVGILVLTTGVGVFATFAGYIANKLLAPKVVDEQDISEGEEKILEKLVELQSAINECKIRENELSLRLTHIEEMMVKEKAR